MGQKTGSPVLVRRVVLLHAIVHPADIQDRDGGILVMATLFGMFPFLKKLFADGGYQGPEFNQALARVLPHLKAEIVMRSDQAKGFVVLPKRWIVERTFRLAQSMPQARQGLGETSIEKRWRSCASPQSASCSENFVIPLDVSEQTLSPSFTPKYP
jgi:transposase